MNRFVCMSVCMSVGMYVCRYVCLCVCLSHFFLNPYILQLIHFTDILLKYKILNKKIRIFLLKYFIQKSSLFIDKS